MNKVFPHIPGVDAAGTVVESGVYEFVEGDRVLVTGFDMGSNRWGGYRRIRARAAGLGRAAARGADACGRA